MGDEATGFGHWIRPLRGFGDIAVHKTPFKVFLEQDAQHSDLKAHFKSPVHRKTDFQIRCLQLLDVRWRKGVSSLGVGAAKESVLRSLQSVFAAFHNLQMGEERQRDSQAYCLAVNQFLPSGGGCPRTLHAAKDSLDQNSQPAQQRRS